MRSGMGWVHSKRDHGGLLFIDLRDHYGVTQCVFPAGSPAFAAADAVRPESVITVTGKVVMREAGTVNPRLPRTAERLAAVDGDTHITVAVLDGRRRLHRLASARRWCGRRIRRHR